MDLHARGLTDLQGYIALLEANGLLIRVKTEVDATLELAGIAKRFEGRKVVLFEQVKAVITRFLSVCTGTWISWQANI